MSLFNKNDGLQNVRDNMRTFVLCTQTNTNKGNITEALPAASKTTQGGTVCAK